MYTSMFRKAMLGDTATLNLDFTTGVLDSRLTFTRAAGTATYINSSGYVTTAAANTPRFDYDPVTLAPRGLLIEGSAINSALYSENINPNSSPQNIYWVVSGTGASVTPVSQTDPANGSTASRCVLGTSTVGRVYQAFSTTSGATYTMSFWAKSVSGNTALHFWHYNSATSNYTAVTVGTSWARYQVTILARSGGGFVEFGIANLTATAATIDLWGMQIELGSGASSYIPTGASQVTRNADSCLMSGTNFSSWYTQGVGTVCWSGSAFRVTAGHLANINTVNNDPRITAYVGAGSLTNLVTNGTTQASISFGTVTANTAFKAAWRFNTNNFAACLNAGTVQTDTVGTVPTGVDRMQLGAAEGGYQFLDGWIKSIKYYPTAFTNAELQTATTL